MEVYKKDTKYPLRFCKKILNNYCWPTNQPFILVSKNGARTVSMKESAFDSTNSIPPFCPSTYSSWLLTKLARQRPIFGAIIIVRRDESDIAGETILVKATDRESSRALLSPSNNVGYLSSERIEHHSPSSAEDSIATESPIVVGPLFDRSRMQRAFAPLDPVSLESR